MPAGSICGSIVRYAGYGRRLTCAVPGYYSQCWSVTTSTIVKRRWHMLRMLSGAIPSTWALAFLAFKLAYCLYNGSPPTEGHTGVHPSFQDGLAWQPLLLVTLDSLQFINVICTLLTISSDWILSWQTCVTKFTLIRWMKSPWRVSVSLPPHPH